MVNAFIMLTGAELTLFKSYMRSARLKFSSKEHRKLAMLNLLSFMDLVESERSQGSPIGALEEKRNLIFSFPLDIRLAGLTVDSEKPLFATMDLSEALIERAEKIRDLIGDEQSEFRDLGSIIVHGLALFYTMEKFRKRGLDIAFINHTEGKAELVSFPE